MNKNRTLSFGEGQKLSMPRSFTTLVKPIGSLCNMRCTYCYYLDKGFEQEASSAPRKVMSDETLRNYVKQYIEANDVDVVTFCWHGGEPLMAGIPFYEKALYYQQKFANGKRIDNTLQTNGLLVNEQWCNLFARGNFLIGVSLDGPQDIHDSYRLDAGGRGTFDRVMKAVYNFQRYGVEYNTLSVVNSLCKGRGVEVYNFLKSIGSKYLQFLPAVEFISTEETFSKLGGRGKILSPTNANSGVVSPWSTTGEDFGKFMCDIFDEWVRRDVGEYYVQLFDATLANWYGVPPGLCAHAQSCGDGLVVEHNGDVYSCDHFVYPEYKLGNIAQANMRTMYTSQKQFDFGVAKRTALPEECNKCNYYFACTGGCPKHRFRENPEQAAKNYLCEGYKAFYEHADPYMERMCELLRSEQAPAKIMQEMIVR